MTKHTSEPWNLDLEDGSITNGNGFGIASVTPHGNVNTIARTGEPFSSADGRLIASSAKLLRMLKEAVDQKENDRPTEDWLNESRELIAYIES